jgi:hypothetical protein
LQAIFEAAVAAWWRNSFHCAPLPPNFFPQRLQGYLYVLQHIVPIIQP